MDLFLRSFLPKLHNFRFSHFSIFAVIVTINNKTNITPCDMDQNGILAVFMQPDTSLDENEYAIILNPAEMSHLHYQIPRVV